LITNLPTQAFVLVGGKGKRLGSKVKFTPKPMLQVEGKPFLDYVLEWLLSNGIKKVVLLAGYLGEKVQEYYENNKLDLDIEIVIENKELGTGGAVFSSLKKAEDFFLVCNGDSICPFSFSELDQLDTGTSTVILAKENNPQRFGVVKHQRGKVMKFEEKRSLKGIASISTGIYIFQKDHFLKYCSSPSSLELNLLPKLVEENKLGCVEVSGELLDIGLPEDLKRANKILKGMSILHN